MRRWWAGLCVGLGGFQVHDGTIQHKLLHLHHIRYHVTLWPYDPTWNLAGLAGMTRDPRNGTAWQRSGKMDSMEDRNGDSQVLADPHVQEDVAGDALGGGLGNEQDDEGEGASDG